MILFVNESFVDRLIANQRSAIRYYLLLSIGLFTIGVVVIVVALLGNLRVAGFRDVVGLGGLFASSLGAFQLKEILQRKEKIGVFKMVKTRLHKLGEEGETFGQTERKRIEELLWKLVEKTAMG